MNISALVPHPTNPRVVSPEKLEQLKKALTEFGDLGGVVFNTRTGHLVGGHQRIKSFNPEDRVVITLRYPKPTKTGTVGEGYVVAGTERFAYREVDWDKNREKAASLAANKNAGEWDVPQLESWLKELSSFDVSFDTSLTMFDPDELKVFTGSTVKEHTRSTRKQGRAKSKRGELYALGDARLRVGDDPHFCDDVIARWRRHSGEDATLIPDESRKPMKKKSAVKQGASRGRRA